MAPEANQVNWRGIRPTNPPEDIPVKQVASILASLTDGGAVGLLRSLERYCRSLNGDHGEQILKANAQFGAGSKVLHTVNDNKVLYLTGAVWSASSLAADHYAAYEIYTAVPGLYAALFQSYHNAASLTSENSITFSRPMKFAAGWRFDIKSNAGGRCYGALFGWEEDA